MASLNYSCNIRQAFNFEKDRQVLVGHLVSLSIGDTTLTQDITLTQPTDYTTVSVVAAISNINWDGGYADPIEIACQIGNENQKQISIMTHTNLSKNNVTLAFNVFAFDQNAKVYYLAFTSGDNALNGLVYKHGGELALQVGTDPSSEVVSPLNFPMYIGIMPQETAQTINVAVSNTDKFVKTWGVSVSGT